MTEQDVREMRESQSLLNFLSQFVFPLNHEAVRDHLGRVATEGVYRKFDFPFPPFYIQQPPFTYCPVDAPSEMRARKMPNFFLLEIYLGFLDFYDISLASEVDTCALFHQLTKGAFYPEEKQSLVPETGQLLLNLSDYATGQRQLILEEIKKEREDWHKEKDPLVLENALLRWCAAWEVHIYRLVDLVRVARRVLFPAMIRNMKREDRREHIHTMKIAPQMVYESVATEWRVRKKLVRGRTERRETKNWEEEEVEEVASGEEEKKDDSPPTLPADLQDQICDREVEWCEYWVEEWPKVVGGVVEGDRPYPEEFETEKGALECFRVVADPENLKQGGYMSHYWVNLDVSGVRPVLTRGIHMSRHISADDERVLKEIVKEYERSQKKPPEDKKQKARRVLRRLQR